MNEIIYLEGLTKEENCKLETIRRVCHFNQDMLIHLCNKIEICEQSGNNDVIDKIDRLQLMSLGYYSRTVTVSEMKEWVNFTYKMFEGTLLFDYYRFLDCCDELIENTISMIKNLFININNFLNGVHKKCRKMFKKLFI